MPDDPFASILSNTRMKRFLFAFLLLGFALSVHCAADERTAKIQAQLKERGFYFGEVDGKPGDETKAAVKRFQIRNGLAVTGETDPGTLEALGLIAAQLPPEPPVQAPPTPKPAVARGPDPKIPVFPDRSTTRTPATPTPMSPEDREFVRNVEPVGKGDRFERDGRLERGGIGSPTRVDPPRSIPEPEDEEDIEPGTFDRIFRGTAFETAPLPLQINTFNKAQMALYRAACQDDISDVPDAETEEALMRYQRKYRLPLTGRLDVGTLNKMDLLPGLKDGPPLKPFRNGGEKIYRGILAR